MKVAIITLFRELRQTLSIVHVVASHLEMLLEAGIRVKMIVSEECLAANKIGVFADERIEWEGICNTFNDKTLEWRDYWNPSIPLHDSFEEEKKMVTKEFIRVLQEVDVVMMHDTLYLGKYYLHNMALREAQKELTVRRWIAFTHSYPAVRPVTLTKERSGRYTPMPHTLYVYPTRSGIGALARQYGIPEALCRVVYNPTPILEGMTEEVKVLHKKVDLLSPDVLVIYPARLSTGKKLEKVAALVGAIKMIGECSVKIIYCDFECSEIEGDVYKKAIREIGDQYGLEREEMVFTSEQGFDKGLARASILDLFTLSNLYICPSLSESFGMTVLEAASKGNLVVINENVTSLREVGKILGAYKMKWDAMDEGYQMVQTYEPSEAAYYGKHAKEIVRLLSQDTGIRAKTQVRKRFNKEWIWKNQLEPLLK